MQITRRKLMGAIAASPAALAQTQPAAPSPDAELKAARERLRSNGEALGKQEISMSTEPAFQFKP